MQDRCSLRTRVENHCPVQPRPSEGNTNTSTDKQCVGSLSVGLALTASHSSSCSSSLTLPSLPPQAASVQQVKAAQNGDDDDDDMDLFGSDEEEDAEAERIKEERVAAYAAKKSKKPALIAKSSILLDVKPVSSSCLVPCDR